MPVSSRARPPGTTTGDAVSANGHAVPPLVYIIKHTPVALPSVPPPCPAFPPPRLRPSYLPNAGAAGNVNSGTLCSVRARTDPTTHTPVLLLPRDPPRAIPPGVPPAPGVPRDPAPVAPVAPAVPLAVAVVVPGTHSSYPRRSPNHGRSLARRGRGRNPLPGAHGPNRGRVPGRSPRPGRRMARSSSWNGGGAPRWRWGHHVGRKAGEVVLEVVHAVPGPSPPPPKSITPLSRRRS